jgi:hypothetical protein
MIFCFTGCNYKDDVTTELLEESGFEIIDKIGHYGDVSIYLVYHSETKVEYIFVNGYCETSLCPYYDDNGNIVIYKGE